MEVASLFVGLVKPLAEHEFSVPGKELVMVAPNEYQIRLTANHDLWELTWGPEVLTVDVSCLFSDSVERVLRRKYLDFLETVCTMVGGAIHMGLFRARDSVSDHYVCIMDNPERPYLCRSTDVPHREIGCIQGAIDVQTMSLLDDFLALDAEIGGPIAQCLGRLFLLGCNLTQKEDAIHMQSA